MICTDFVVAKQRGATRTIRKKNSMNKNQMQISFWWNLKKWQRWTEQWRLTNFRFTYTNRFSNQQMMVVFPASRLHFSFKYDAAVWNKYIILPQTFLNNLLKFISKVKTKKSYTTFFKQNISFHEQHFHDKSNWKSEIKWKRNW